jgi:hypothetical protein
MIEKKIEVCIGTDRQGGVRARLSLLLVDGGQVIHEHFHSVTLMPGDDCAVIRANVEAHIAAPNGGVPGAPWPAIPDAEWAKVEAVIPVFHTPDRVAAALARRR